MEMKAGPRSKVLLFVNVVFSTICPPFKMTESTMENPGGWRTRQMGGVASVGSRGYEQSRFSRGVGNFHSLYRPLGWYFNSHHLCLQRVFIALMALRWLNSLGLRNFYLLVRSINHLDTRWAYGGEINGSVISPALEPQPQQGQIIPRRSEHLSRGQQRSHSVLRGRVMNRIFTLHWSIMCLRQNLHQPLELFHLKDLQSPNVTKLKHLILSEPPPILLSHTLQTPRVHTVLWFMWRTLSTFPHWNVSPMQQRFISVLTDASPVSR